MKEATDLTWCGLRELKRHLKQTGLSMPNEHKLREVSQSLTGDHIVTQMVDFVDAEGHTQSEAFGRVACISDFVTNMLEAHKQQNTLTWHNSSIPQNEIWVKFGGDHGKDSLKFTMQIANINKPNSKHNTFVVAMAKVKDSYENLRICMSILQQQLEELSRLEWDGKKIVLFLFGDYDFLVKLYGLSGAQGTYPCLWCLTPKSDMKSMLKNDHSLRSLANIKRSHRRFMKYGYGLKKNVKRYHNCLHHPMLEVEPEKVAPPYLHILLGIVLKHHRQLEEAAHDIYVQLVHQSMEDCTPGIGQNVHIYGKNWKRAEKNEGDIQLTSHHRPTTAVHL